MKLEWLGGLVIVGLLIGSGALLVKLGNMQGESTIQAKWDMSKKATADEVSALKVAIARKEAEHKLSSQENSDELARTQKEHEQAMVALRTDYTKRLLSIEARTGVYQRLSRGTAIERDRLVEHTAQLDRTLEEGRSLVGELQETVRQCEITVGVLGTQILLDRDLLK